MKRLVVSSSPHIHTKRSTSGIMLDVIISLIPSLVAGVIIFGLNALLVVMTCVVAAVLSELIFNLAVKKEQTVGDLSAVVTGLILGLNLHAGAPLWQCAVGSAFAIIVVKCLFGGLGCNFANPAAAARVFLLISFASSLGGGALPLSGEEIIVTGATPLASLAQGGSLPSLLDMFLGMRGGAVGETCILAILIGYAYLVLRGVIKFEIPLIFTGSVFLLTLILSNDLIYSLYSILSGGLIFAAVFMATDYVSTPITRSGKMIFAFGAGLITVMIRFYGTYPEGVSFSILLMNILSPYIEKWTAPHPLGAKEGVKK